MSLGQNIYRLRTSREMSQLALAEALGVSRQSISKWETDASVPELDKLVKLSELFGVTIDELVKDSPAAEDDAPDSPQADAPPPQYVYVKPERSGRKTAGIILLCMGFLVLLLLSLFGAFLGGLIFCSPFIICGLICLCVRRLPGLWCAWALYFLVTLYLQYATGITWTWAFNTALLQNAHMNMHIIIAFFLLAALITLVLITAYCLRHPHIELKENWKKPLIALIVIIAIRIGAHFLSHSPIQTLIQMDPVPHFAIAAINTCSISLRTVCFTALMSLASRCISWKR